MLAPNFNASNLFSGGSLCTSGSFQASLGFDLSVFGMAIGGMLIRGIITSELRADMQRLESQLAAHHG